ncbi:Uncharacterised protein [Moraxella caprae]|uniref:Uncharacterized protein n=1 Tax=Moraxella caprae TaxID=90240 RepID=A0A378QXR1_9GAMM|nr:hypothetical protein [Moraxella caprae]STZ07782.1 Uncharacterised protein [Moraxella caprae]
MIDLPPNLPQEVRAVLPIMASLDLQKRASIAQFLLASDSDSKPKISRLGADSLGVAYVSDDFDDELGDEFWFGEKA